MSDSLYSSRVTLEQPGSLHRRAQLETGERFDMSVHGAIAAFYKLSPERATRSAAPPPHRSRARWR